MSNQDPKQLRLKVRYTIDGEVLKKPNIYTINYKPVFLNALMRTYDGRPDLLMVDYITDLRKIIEAGYTTPVTNTADGSMIVLANTLFLCMRNPLAGEYKFETQWPTIDEIEKMEEIDEGIVIQDVCRGNTDLYITTKISMYGAILADNSSQRMMENRHNYISQVVRELIRRMYLRMICN